MGLVVTAGGKEELGELGGDGAKAEAKEELEAVEAPAVYSVEG